LLTCDIATRTKQEMAKNMDSIARASRYEGLNDIGIHRGALVSSMGCSE
jgi:hypothetical protein